MAAETGTKVPPAQRIKPSDCAFDLDQALTSIVAVRVQVPEDAFTAPTLGTERAGYGVAIRDNGLVLTIGYLVVEAETIWLRTHDNRSVPAHALAYDQESGFGLVQALAPLNVPALPIGDSDSVDIGDTVIVAGHGGRENALSAEVVACEEFAGYWEYVLDKALFTTPSHPNWGGTAIIAQDGTLVGIGSLQMEQARQSGTSTHLNMIVPINLLAPIMQDLLRSGRRAAPPRPWLGLYAAQIGDQIVVAGTADDGPAEVAGLHGGDVVLELAGKPVTTLTTFWRRIWALGPAGVDVPMRVRRDGRVIEVQIASADRARFTRTPVLH